MDTGWLVGVTGEGGRGGHWLVDTGNWGREGGVGTGWLIRVTGGGREGWALAGW